MRFITEFELVLPAIKKRIDAYKANSQFEMGGMISIAFEWKEAKYPDYRGGNDISRHTLEIEAFPMDKWIGFKQKLLDNLNYGSIERNDVIFLIKELESFGKAAEEAISLPKLEYRGPNSHCKACEEERAGIKHITAQKHTCKKINLL